MDPLKPTKMQSKDLISIRECAQRLTDAQDPIKNPALGRYIKKHNLKRGTGPRRAVLVNFDEVKKHREENFTREWMSGSKKKTSAAKIKPKKATNKKSSTPDKPDDNVVKIDRAREAKTMREEALAKQELLNLEERLGNVIYLDQTEAGLALAVDAVRDRTQGAGASDFADLLISKFKLPSAVKREILAEIKIYGTDLQTSLSDSFAALISNLTSDDMNDVRNRHDALTDLAFTLRSKPIKSKAAKA